MKTAKDFEILEEEKTDELYNNFLSKFNVESEDSCWMWEAVKDKDGYWIFSFKRKNIRAHRFSYAFFKGQIPKGMVVMHECDCPSCVNPKHLAIGTDKDNMIDCARKGRINPPIGSRSGSSKLSEEDVKLIKKLKGSKITQKELALLFDVTVSNIYQIQNNKTWKHVTI